MKKTNPSSASALCAIVFLFLAGCSSTWAPVLETSPEPPRWIDSSNRTRAIYVESIKGFQETGTTVAGVMKSIVFGNRQRENLILRPVAAVVGPDNRIAIADIECACVHVYVPAEKRYTKIQVAGKETLKTPVSVAFGDDSRLYVSDSTRKAIYLFDRDGNFSSAIKQVGDAPLQRPTGLWYSPERKTLYAIDTLAKKVHALSDSGAPLFSFGNPGEQQAQFNFPTHITGDAAGRIYITDAMNFRVQIFDKSGKFLSAFGHHGNGSGDFALPKGIAIDGQNVVYVVDTLFDNIQLFDLTGHFLFTIGRRGDGEGEFSMPSGLFLDKTDRLYVSDTYHQQVQIFQIMEYPE